MDKKDKHREDIIAKMAATLRDHEEAYAPGAWERFKVSQDSHAVPPGPVPMVARKVSPWIWRAAAVVLMALGVYFTINDRSVSEEALWSMENTERGAVPLQPKAGAPTSDAPMSGAHEPETASITAPGTSSKTVSGTASDAILVERPASANIRAYAQSADLPQIASVEAGSPTLLGTKVSTQQTTTRNVEVHPFGEPVFAATEPAPADEQWGLGLVVSSALTTEKVNYGGGLHVTYRLNDRLSLSSGLGIGKYGVNTNHENLFSAVTGKSSGSMSDLPQSAPNSPSVGDNGTAGPGGANKPGASLSADKMPAYFNRTLTGVTTELVALDIPLEINYKLTETFYTSFGVSFIGFLNENRTNHYVDVSNSPIPGLEGYSTTGLRYQVQAVHVQESAVEEPLRGQGYAGFVNFSVGRAIPFNARMNLSVEPFLKLPIGRLQNEEMNLTNAGFRVVVGF